MCLDAAQPALECSMTKAQLEERLEKAEAIAQQLSVALCKCPVMTPAQENAKYAALEAWLDYQQETDHDTE